MAVDRETLSRRQRALANFGELARCSDDLQEILDEACRLVADALSTDLAKILELEPSRQAAIVRAGVGWNDDVVGKVRLQLGDPSSETFALAGTAPVVTQDIAKEDRFEFAQFMKDHGVVAIVNTPIFLPGGRPFGLLQVDAREPRCFDEEDIEFLRTYCMVLGAVIDRLQAVAERGESDERFRLVVEHALDHAIILSDPLDLVTGWFPGSAAILGWTEAEMVGSPTAKIFTLEDQAADVPRAEVERALMNGTAPNVRWHATKSGKRVFLDGLTIALRGQDGTLRGFLKIAQDITERRRAEERQLVLQAELQHRVRNVLAMISAVVNRGDIRGTAKELRASLSGRIAAMARTQALLTRGEDTGVDLEGMIRDELSALFAGDHAILTGPVVLLSPKAAEVLTLGIHELTTNALKYGALMWPHGRIDVSWRSFFREGQDWLELEWRESGGRIPPDPERRRGFGTELITRRVPYELKGRGEMDLPPDGLQCRISFPLTPGDSVLQTSVPVAGRTQTGH